MPEKRVKRRAQRDKAQGKAPMTQAGEFVEEEIEHVREGKPGARSAKQAIAIGLSKARRAGVSLPPRKAAPKRKRAVRVAQKREGRAAAPKPALSRQARTAAARRRASERTGAAKRTAKTKGPGRRKAAARKAARTREARRE